jgi:hypothetical protein
MAPKHDEIVRRQADGWALAWDASEGDPATRRAVDKIVAQHVEALHELLRGEKPRRAAEQPRAA